MKVAVFASGTGSNAGNILRHVKNYPDLISIPLLVCDKEGAPVIEKARSLGVEVAVIPRSNGKAAQEAEIVKRLKAAEIDWIFLAGYMAILSAEFVAAYAGRIVNIHPSLLPQFAGKDGYGDAWRAGVSESGVTLHYVDAGVDTGPVIEQARFARLPEDDFESFRARGMQREYALYRAFIDRLVKGEVA